MTTKTTKKTPTLADIAQGSRDALAEATETLQERRTALAAVQEEVAAVKRSWAAGDGSVPASRLTELEHEQVRLTALTDAAERRHRVAERSVKTDDPALAKAVCHALGTSIYGVLAEPVCATPKAVGDGQPHVYVVQTKPHAEDPRHGTLSGDVTLWVERPSWAKPLDQKELRHTLKQAGVQIKSGAVMSGDKLNLGIIGITPEIPRIANLTEGMEVSAAGVSVAHAVEPHFEDYRSGVLAGVLDSGGQVVGVSVDKDGTRTTKVDVSLTIRNNSMGAWDATTAIEQTKKILAGLTGRPLSACGRITGIEHLDVKPVEYEFGGKGRRITTRFTTISRVA